MTGGRLAIGSIAAALVAGAAASSGRESAGHPIANVAVAGPALTGGSVVWGEQYADGSLAIVRRAPGRRPRVVHRIAPPRAANGTRNFIGLPGALTASRERIAFGLFDGRRDGDGDVVRISGEGQAWIARSTFRRALARCESDLVTTASRGRTVALAQNLGDCGGAVRSRIWLSDGRRQRVLYAAAGNRYFSQVRLTGPWVAWVEGDGGGRPYDEVVVAERSTGRVVARIDGDDLGEGGGIMEFDLAADGTVVALSGRQPRCMFQCLTTVSIRGGEPRTITRRASDRGLATAGGRIAYVTADDIRPAALVLSDMRGRRLRTLDRFTRSRRPVGDVALTARRVAWSVAHTSGDVSPGVRGSVLSRRLARR